MMGTMQALLLSAGVIFLGLGGMELRDRIERLEAAVFMTEPELEALQK